MNDEYLMKYVIPISVYNKLAGFKIEQFASYFGPNTPYSILPVESRTGKIVTGLDRFSELPGV